MRTSGRSRGSRSLPRIRPPGHGSRRTTAYSPASETASITVNAVNDAPVQTVPLANQAAHTGVPLIFDAAHGNPISVADADAGSAAIEVGLYASYGTLVLGH